jgi:DNA-binding transcriptional ArsR family regulator
VPEVRNRETDRAEVFDALGHPTRINILKLLSHEAVSFADLKKKTDIDSSGHLQHHLTKLDGLIKTDEHGNYRLSEAGNDALFVMQTVETVSRQGRRRLAPYSRKSRMLLSTIVVVVAAILIVSTWHLSNVNFDLHEGASQTLNLVYSQYANLAQSAAQYVTNLTQFAAEYSEYATQNQYVCDIMTGSLWERPSMGPSLARELPPQEWFNFTAVVISELDYTGHGYGLINAATVPFFSPPERNDTYYRQGFLKYDLTIFGPNGDDLYNPQTYPVIGPDGWNGQVVASFHGEIPPYPTVQTSGHSANFSGGVPIPFTTIVPITTFGNYTFCLRNEGNTTMQVSWAIATPIITLETKPLQVGDYPAWRPYLAEERIVRIRQQSRVTPPSPPTMPALLPTTPPSLPTPQDTATATLTASTLAILSTTILAALSILIINRRKL